MNSYNQYTDCIRAVGQQLIDSYNKTGSIICGVNGPYNDPETKVRNLAHLIVLTACEIIIFGEEYGQSLKAMGDELLSLADSSGVFVLRKKETKDKCNGVIGHSWIIEALVYLYKVFKDRRYLDCAFSLVQRHTFNEGLCLWNRPIKSGEDLVDYTLNHQLWFAASVAELNFYFCDHTLALQLDAFMNDLHGKFLISKGGRISHNIINRTKCIATIKQRIKKCINDFDEKRNCPSMAYKEAGYHAFNLMALARIYVINDKYSFFKDAKFIKSLNYLNTHQFFDGLNDSNYDLDKSLANDITDEDELSINIYGYPYNVPGFEVLYINKAFNNRIKFDMVDRCLKEQFDYTFENGQFSNRCFDKSIVNYRTYEYYRFLEINE